MTRKVIRLLIFLGCAWLSLGAFALPRIQVVANPDGEAQELVRALGGLLGDEAELVTSPTVLPDVQLLVVLSGEAFRRLPESRPPALLLTPSPSNTQLQKQDGALYWAPSLAAQLALIRYLLPGTNRIGMLVSNPEDASWIRTFRQYASEQSIDVRYLMADKSRLARQVAELAAGSDVLLAQPDPDIYNRDSIRLVLLAAYRQNKVFVGPSPAFVQAGSLATLYAPTTAIAEGIASQVHHFIRNGKLPAPSRVRQLSVSLNAQVAKAMGLTIPSAKELERLIRFEELPTWP
ncbi:ABC transporter substrate binding protein [Fluviicoccus keumensis]|uniref:ABC transporter substrate binding protein n=1 Tax=Fluviicoccus keumensis TaxID=1435465 RepID=A0A4Q7ZC46_9GAMM|nr:ABC transporter substrate binding protein [Fluviicoccus keumensis]RZU47535.1 ABC transporter substrate binding protein [Fluviicoccus keumensis]